MPPRNEKSHLKRTRVWTGLPRHLWSLGALCSQFFQGSLPDEAAENKKPRRSGRLSSQLTATATDKTPIKHDNQLPSPLTRGATDGSSDLNRESTPTPAGARTEDETTPRRLDETRFQSQGLSSPPQDTQPLSQFADRHPAFTEDAREEEEEGVWGYLVALDPKYGDKPIVLKTRCACPMPDSISTAANGEADKKGDTPDAIREEEAYERTKVKGIASGGYLIGRHPECGKYKAKCAPHPRAVTNCPALHRCCCQRGCCFQPPLPPFHRKQRHRRRRRC